jgi:hypothetical protein
MDCEWGYNNCPNEGTKCHLCTTNGFHYKAPKQKSTGGFGSGRIKTKETSRQGSISEVKNARNNDRLLTAVTTGTPNSGAGKIKGDEQIRGLINIMEEVKTTVKKNLNKEPGKESFTLQRAWMDKLEAEAAEAGMEFSYLKFSFKEHDDKFYIIADQSVFMDMVSTMVHDRREAKLAQGRIDVAERRSRALECENIKLIADMELLKAEKRLQEMINSESDGDVLEK